MSRKGPASRVAGMLFAAALLTGGLAEPAAAGSVVTDVQQPFAAHSGDACRMGVAKGTFVWHLLSAAGRSVDGKATVVDRPVPTDPTPGCTDDARYTVLTLTAYASGAMVDRAAVEADNSSRELAFRLVASVPIDTILVQVCRRPRLPGPATYCGDSQTYRAPITTTG